jgi:hypothetical protein
MNENCQFLADFYVVLLISLIWLCVCEICYSVVCVICDCQIVDRSLFLVRLIDQEHLVH